KITKHEYSREHPSCFHWIAHSPLEVAVPPGKVLIVVSNKIDSEPSFPIRIHPGYIYCSLSFERQGTFIDCSKAIFLRLCRAYIPVGGRKVIKAITRTNIRFIAISTPATAIFGVRPAITVKLVVP